MKVYDSGDIRNIALVGHQGAGKTMISEAMLFASGKTNRMGTIGDGSTVSDYHDSEHKREMSIFASMIHAEHKGRKINVLDTPGYPDFMGEVVSSLKVADAAVFVLNATDPIQVGTEVAWGFANKSELPVVFVVNHCDKSGVDFPAVVEAIQKRFGRSATMLQMPVGDGTRSVVDILQMKQLKFPEKGDYESSDIDGGFKERAETLRNELVENVAENDEELMEKGADESQEWKRSAMEVTSKVRATHGTRAWARGLRWGRLTRRRTRSSSRATTRTPSGRRRCGRRRLAGVWRKSGSRRWRTSRGS